MIGEAMDSGDKSSNKAMSAAYKYACFQAFCIPTEGDNDADNTTHDIAPRIGTPVPSLPAAWESWTLEQRGINRANAGIEPLRHWFEQLTTADKLKVKPHVDDWKRIAAAVLSPEQKR